MKAQVKNCKSSWMLLKRCRRLPAGDKLKPAAAGCLLPVFIVEHDRPRGGLLQLMKIIYKYQYGRRHMTC
jgi:hypothetical protein